MAQETGHAGACPVYCPVISIGRLPELEARGLRFEEDGVTLIGVSNVKVSEVSGPSLICWPFVTACAPVPTPAPTPAPIAAPLPPPAIPPMMAPMAAPPPTLAAVFLPRDAPWRFQRSGLIWYDLPLNATLVSDKVFGPSWNLPGALHIHDPAGHIGIAWYDDLIVHVDRIIDHAGKPVADLCGLQNRWCRSCGSRTKCRTVPSPLPPPVGVQPAPAWTQLDRVLPNSWLRR